MEQISDAPIRMETSEEAARRLAGGWSGRGPKQHQRAIVDIAKALTAARIEGVREGLERAAQWHDERAKQLHDQHDYGAALNEHGWSARAIRALAKELPHDHD